MTTESVKNKPIVPSTGIGLYLHVPFCKTKCTYCDFNTYQGIENLIQPYLDAVTEELALWGKVLGHPKVNTVFFGGGTPSYLPAGSIQRVLDAAKSAFEFQEDAEITVEANPDDLQQPGSGGSLRQVANRLSIGVQSLDDGLLEMLTRRHSANEAKQAYRTARSDGFANINLDLMYGLTNQSMAQWQDTLHEALSLDPTHFSLYCLTLEEGTPLHLQVQQGKVPEPDPDLAADMYQHARSSLGKAGYHHYEISNWSLPGYPARHNMTYWLNQPYLGVGPGAHSRLGRFRFWDVSSPQHYTTAVKRWRASDPGVFSAFGDEQLDTVTPVAGREYIDEDTACAETMLLGLRLLDGMDLAEASSQVGSDLGAKYQPQIADLVEQGLLEQQNGHLRLAEAAYLIANQVFVRFLAEPIA